MLSNSGITALSFANKVVKVQSQKFVRSLYGVPRTSQNEGFINLATSQPEFMLVKNLTYDSGSTFIWSKDVNVITLK